MLEIIDSSLSVCMVLIVVLGASLFTLHHIDYRIKKTTSLVLDCITEMEEKALTEYANGYNDIEEKAYYKQKYQLLVENRVKEYDQEYSIHIPSNITFLTLIGALGSLATIVLTVASIAERLMNITGLNSTITVMALVWASVLFFGGLYLSLYITRNRYHDHFILYKDEDNIEYGRQYVIPLYLIKINKDHRSIFDLDSNVVNALGFMGYLTLLLIVSLFYMIGQIVVVFI